MDDLRAMDLRRRSVEPGRLTPFDVRDRVSLDIVVIIAAVMTIVANDSKKASD
jgi:hypothetical protein